MTKMLIATLVPVALLGFLVISVSWFLSERNDRIVRALTQTCVDRGYIASSSIERGFLTSHVTFHCVKSTSRVSSQ